MVYQHLHFAEITTMSIKHSSLFFFSEHLDEMSSINEPSKSIQSEFIKHMKDDIDHVQRNRSFLNFAILRRAREKIILEVAKGEPDLRRLVTQCEMVDRLIQEDPMFMRHNSQLQH
jgi:hypothetical protein